MAEQNNSIRVNLKEIRDKYQENSKCGSCEDNQDYQASAFCVHCDEMICSECVAAHKQIRATRNHEIIELQQKAQTNTYMHHCLIHPGNTTNAYCEACDEMICSECIATHNNHKHDTIENIFPQNKKEIVAALEPVKQQLNHVTQTLDTIEMRMKDIEKHGTRLQTEIVEEIDEQKQQLDQLKEKRVKELKNTIKQKIETLKTQQEKAQTVQKRLSTCLEKIDNEIKKVEPVVRKKEMIKFIRRSKDQPITTDAKSMIEWSIELNKEKEQLEAACQNFLAVIDTASISIDNSHIIGDIPKSTLNGETRILVFQAKTQLNTAHEGKAKVEATLVHAKNSEATTCDVIPTENGRYLINVQPEKRGKHELHLTVNGATVNDSPFSIPVMPSLQSLTKPIKTVSGINKVRAVAINSKGHTIVVEGGGNCISVLNEDGRKTHTFGTQGTKRGQFDAYGLTVDKHDYIYVLDYSNHCIHKFSPQGVLLTSSGSKGKGQMQFNYAYCIIYNPRDGFLYVADSYNHRIQVLTTDLKYVRSLGQHSSVRAEFNVPMGVALDSANNMYITDYNNDSIKVFTANGQYLRSFAHKADGKKLYNPWAIAIDSSDIVYVSEKGPHCVSVFNSKGAYITTFGEEGSQSGQFKSIYGMVIDHNDSIVVADNGNHRLQIF